VHPPPTQGLHKDLELRTFTLLSQQSQPASSSTPEAARATLPVTLLTHAKLVGRWFRTHCQAAAGDPHLMLGELIKRRAEEAEGSDDALLEAGAFDDRVLILCTLMWGLVLCGCVFVSWAEDIILFNGPAIIIPFIS
jgi:hypothetical protein